MTKLETRMTNQVRMTKLPKTASAIGSLSALVIDTEFGLRHSDLLD